MKTKEPHSVQIDSQWRWHYRQLARVYSQLLGERSRRTRDWTAAEGAADADPTERVTNEFERDLQLSAVSFDQGILYEVEAALKRIENHTYGFCEVTGRPIPAERLQALPWTRYLAEVEAQLERAGVVARHQLGAVGSVHAPPAARGRASGDDAGEG